MNAADLKDVMLHSINYYLHYSTSSKLQRSVMFIETSRVKTFGVNAIRVVVVVASSLGYVLE